ncbi:ribulokinase [Larkinella humicola]|uniref:Ribulokinase n=1 Tax=Larkinella humicola TaxID=2607654 RepID=A0A5N1J689_9BACT|nr:ribulokinase [Larkinella humicola]KAA9346227.1 ribulokinase [Larkinella humicola]
MPYVIGVDFGTDSVRAVLVNAETGDELASGVHEYVRWKTGAYCDPARSQFRQHPLDYLEGLEQSVRSALRAVSPDVIADIRGISVDTTGSTPGPVDENGTPLALLPPFADNPNGMFILWKDHTANQEAEEINQLAHRWNTDFTKYVGGIYSSEWFWSKILRTLRVDESIRPAAFSWIEHCDWISAVLTGNTNPLTLKRSRTAAGHKALWHAEFDGLPSEEFLTTLDPLLAGLRDRLFRHTYTSDEPMGTISAEWAEKLGVPTTVVIGVGGFDAHMGAVGANIESYALVKVIGTSTCDMLMAPSEDVGHLLIRGICGQVDGSIVPGMLGMEAGQSAFGDLYAWFTRLILEPVAGVLTQQGQASLIPSLQTALLPYLAEQASQLPVSETDIVSLDWLNGRRTPDANHTLKGAISGLNLGSSAAHVFKSLVEATAYGARRIAERFVEEGVPIQQVIAIGGVARKSAFVMQTLADVMNVPIKVAESDQCCARGAAVCAAVAAGIYPTFAEAQKAMASAFDAVYTPRPERASEYDVLYERYLSLGGFIEKKMPPTP